MSVAVVRTRLAVVVDGWLHVPGARSQGPANCSHARKAHQYEYKAGDWSHTCHFGNWKSIVELTAELSGLWNQIVAGEQERCRINRIRAR